MQLQTIPSSLHELDRTEADVIACGIWSSDRPPHGLAGLLDWRLCGGLSQLLYKRSFLGEGGELLLYASESKPPPFHRILFLGIGEKSHFDLSRFIAMLQRFVSVCESIRARTAIIEIPSLCNTDLESGQDLDAVLSAMDSSATAKEWFLFGEEEKRIRWQIERQKMRARANELLP